MIWLELAYCVYDVDTIYLTDKCYSNDENSKVLRQDRWYFFPPFAKKGKRRMKKGHFLTIFNKIEIVHIPV